MRAPNNSIIKAERRENRQRAMMIGVTLAKLIEKQFVFTAVEKWSNRIEKQMLHVLRP